MFINIIYKNLYVYKYFIYININLYVSKYYILYTYIYKYKFICS